jgi:hypothetical protein
MVREDDVVTVSSFGESKNKEELKVKSNESQVVPENTDAQ